MIPGDTRWTKIDPVLSRWAQEEAAAKSSDTSQIPPSIQAKLTVSTPGDKYEQEADAMAAKVMAMPDRAIESQQIASKQSNSTTAALQRAVNEDKTVSPELENRIQNATGGSPLPEAVRSFMESRFEVDFSEIRVHTDGAAAQMCKEVGAKAFAVGNRIYYGAGYTPGKNELTAHELTHTIQQGAAKRFNRQVQQLPEPQEVLVAKEINISPPYNNRQVYKFPLEETAPEPQKVEPTFNRVSRQIAVEELPESTLPTKQFTYKAEPNFNKFSPKTSEKQIGAKKFISRETQLPGAVKQISAKSDQSELEIKEKIRKLLSKTGNLVDLIASNPEAFLNNLIGGLKLGFNNFSTNIRSHLQNALISWLTGTLGSIQMPPAGTPTVKGFFSIVLQVLGITWSYIRTKAVAEYGEAMVNRMEQSVKIFQQVKELPMEMWDHVKKLIQGQQQGLIEEVKTTVVNTVIVQLVNKFISLLTPAAGVRALMTVYNILKFFIEKCHQVMELVTAVIDAVKAIADGKMAGIASSVEKALSRSLPVLIGTWAATLGIESVAAKIRGLISKMQKSIDNTIVYFIKTVRNLVPAVNQGNRTGQTLRRGQGNGNRKRDINFVKTFEMAGEEHHLYVNGKNNQLSVKMASVYPEDLKKLVDDAMVRESSKGTQANQQLLKELREINEYLMKTIFPLYERFEFSNDQQKNEYSLRLNGLISEIEDIGTKFGIRDLRDVGKKPPAEMVKKAIESTTIIPFLREIAKGKTVLGVDRNMFVKVFKDRTQLINRKPAAEWIENKFRGVKPGTHEWILTKLLPEVVEKAASSKTDAWINLQNDMRSDTSWIVFKPKRVTTTEIFKGKSYNVYHGHPGALEIDGIDKVQGQYQFHVDLENQFKISNTPNICIQNVQKVFVAWVWDGKETLINVHPRLELDGTLVQQNLANITQNQVIRFNKMNDNFNNLKNKYK